MCIYQPLIMHLSIDLLFYIGLTPNAPFSQLYTHWPPISSYFSFSIKILENFVDCSENFKKKMLKLFHTQWSPFFDLSPNEATHV